MDFNTIRTRQEACGVFGLGQQQPGTVLGLSI